MIYERFIMKKVGIITLFYNNYNYGGMLQAFALQQFIEMQGFECEQIAINRMEGGKKDWNYKIKKIYWSLRKAPYRLLAFTRRKRFRQFQDIVKHSSSIGVSCFMLISGYFGVKYNIKKIFRFIVKAVFYAGLGYVILVFAKVVDFSIGTMVIRTFSVLLNQNWYLCCYIALMIFSPYINKMLLCLTEKEYRRLLLSLVVLLSVVPTFIYYDLPGRTSKDLLEMTMLYVMGDYIKRFNICSKISKTVAFSGFVVSLLITEIMNILLLYITGEHKNYFSRDNCIFVIAAAIFLFVLILNIEIKSKYLEKIAVFSLDIYLLNDSFVLPLLNKKSYNYISGLGPFMGLGIIVEAGIALAFCTVIAKMCRSLIYWLSNTGEKIVRCALSMPLLQRMRNFLLTLL